MNYKCQHCNFEQMASSESDMTVAFDVDETLVVWDYPQDKFDETIIFDNYGYAQRLLPHKFHIERLKQHAARGHKVYVWSAGGVEWATSVIKCLGLEEYVYHVMCKFQWHYDDLPSSEFLHKSTRVYLDPYTGLNHFYTHALEKDEDEN